MPALAGYPFETREQIQELISSRRVVKVAAGLMNETGLLRGFTRKAAHATITLPSVPLRALPVPAGLDSARRLLCYPPGFDFLSHSQQISKQAFPEP